MSSCYFLLIKTYIMYIMMLWLKLQIKIYMLYRTATSGSAAGIVGVHVQVCIVDVYGVTMLKSESV